MKHTKYFAISLLVLGLVAVNYIVLSYEALQLAGVIASAVLLLISSSNIDIQSNKKSNLGWLSFSMISLLAFLHLGAMLIDYLATMAGF